MTPPKPALPEPTLLWQDDGDGWDGGSKVYGYTAAQMQAAIDAAVAEARAGLERECDDTDKLLRGLGLDPERCRTEGGALNVGKTLALLAEARAVPEGWKLLKDTTHAERSWPEDSSHENGNYSNTCVHCLRGFVGHKRRPSCKMCAATPSPAEQPKPAVREALAKVVSTYDAYRRRGVSPAPAEYADVVAAIEAARAALQGEPHD